MIRTVFLAVRGDTFDVQVLRRDIEAIAQCFGDYLSQVGSGGSSKHRALGAVGKALQRARVTRGDALLGYARRVHEQTIRSTFPGGAVDKLDEGLRKLDVLLSREDVPARAVREILERVDYATYYDVRHRWVEFQGAWKQFVRDNAARLDLDVKQESDPPWFSRTKLSNRGPKWEQAVREFLAARKDAAAMADIDNDEEDEG